GATGVRPLVLLGEQLQEGRLPSGCVWVQPVDTLLEAGHPVLYDRAPGAVLHCGPFLVDHRPPVTDQIALDRGARRTGEELSGPCQLQAGPPLLPRPA